MTSLVDADEHSDKRPQPWGRWSSLPRYSAAISPHHITLVGSWKRRGVTGPISTQVFELHPPLQNGDWSGIYAAFAQLSTALPPDARVALCLLRPLYNLKRVTIPVGVGSSPRQLLQQNIGRFLAFPQAPVEIAFQSTGGRSGRSQSLIVAAAPSELLFHIDAAASAAEVSVEFIVPGAIAATAGVSMVLRSARNKDCAVVLENNNFVEVLFISRGKTLAVRTAVVPAPDPPQGCGDLPTSPKDRAVTGATMEVIERLTAEGAQYFKRTPSELVFFTQSGVFSGKPSHPKVNTQTNELARVDAPSLSGDELAALGARRCSSLRSVHFRSDTEIQSFRDMQGRRSRLLFALAAALLFAAGIIFLDDLRAEHRAVLLEKEKLRPAVETLSSARIRESEAAARTMAINAAMLSRTRWPHLLLDIAHALPRDAHLLGIQADSSRIRLEIRATTAAAVLAAFNAAPEFTDIRLAAPVRREMTSFGDFERLTLDVSPPVRTYE